MAPRVRIASSAYREQVGEKRHWPAEPPRERALVDMDRADEDQPAGRRASHRKRRRDVTGATSTLEQFGHLGRSGPGSGAPDRLAGHQDDVVSFHATRRDLTDRCPKDPPGSVPLHRAADLLAGDQADSPEPGATNSTTRVPCSGVPPGRPAGSPRVRTDAQPETEATAALASACGEDRPAGARPHPEAEPVGLRPTAGVRLVRALPLGHPRILSKRKPATRRPKREVYGNIPARRG